MDARANENQQPPLLSESPPPKGPAKSSGFDNVYEFFNGILSTSVSNTAQQLPTRLGLNGLWGWQQSTTQAASTTPGPGPIRASGSVLSGSPSAPTLQPRVKSNGLDPPENQGEEFVGKEVHKEMLAFSLDPKRQTRGVSSSQNISPRRGDTSDSMGDREVSSSSHRHGELRGQPYDVDPDDLLDQHVAYFLRHHPDIHAQHAIRRKRPGVYRLDGREILVEWQYASDPCGQGFLVIVDGPLRQPFSDYMEMTENNAEYDSESCNRSSLCRIPKEQRMSFHDQHKVYTRLEAMKVAREQAAFREKHADYVKEGKEAPSDLMATYKKTIQQKLGQQGRPVQPEPATPGQNEADAHFAVGPPPVNEPISNVTGYHFPPNMRNNVFAAEPMDFFESGDGGQGIAGWGAPFWGAPEMAPQAPASQRQAQSHHSGAGHSVVVTPPVPPPSWQRTGTTARYADRM